MVFFRHDTGHGAALVWDTARPHVLFWHIARRLYLHDNALGPACGENALGLGLSLGSRSLDNRAWTRVCRLIMDQPRNAGLMKHYYYSFIRAMGSLPLVHMTLRCVSTLPSLPPVLASHVGLVDGEHFELMRRGGILPGRTLRLVW